jgi:plastocyanin
MSSEMRLKALRTAMAQYRSGKISRRQFAGLLGALGISAASLPLLRGGKSAATAAPGGGHAGHGFALAQEEGTPPPVATPVLGVQPDGTRVWKVAVGGFAPEQLAEISAFLPQTITINAGDTIYFENMGFHTITFLSGAETPKLFIPSPDPAMPPAATPPASGASAPVLIANPAALFPAGGPSYDGTGVVNSGVPLDPTAPPFTLTFTTAGEYDYICLVHPKYMTGKVIVQEAGAALPMEQDGVDAQAQQELAAFTERAAAVWASVATPAAAAEVQVGPSDENVELLAFVPNEVRIKAGEAVHWVYKGSMSPHTVTFLGGAEAVEDVLFTGGEAGPPTVVLNPNSLFPSDSVGQPYSGEGLVNSGYLGAPTEVVGWDGYQRVETFDLTFAAPGEYKYYCILHAGGPDDPPTEGMTGKVIVE